ncbi:hypothetical protein BT96DRAFT_1016620 [Gymnopus androsaceus JB14]|uniref:Uncharacterized protein n=1 Tax=Gymnopus androsaceus JB14 TaxID=1447944 RepID=A0A6A4I4D2_9AGAR|nr:hypothetical protein BT96DRAFT_1016620 [Gymnopus androsaceus JB14]
MTAAADILSLLHSLMNSTQGSVIMILIVILFSTLYLKARIDDRAHIDKYAAIRKDAQTLYSKAWGKAWPKQKHEAIWKNQVVPAGYSVNDVDGYVFADVANIPESFEYTCLYEVKQVADILQSTAEIADVLLVRQPGIGKTTFLLYLLLHRLEHKLPTAIQLSHECYFIFDEDGVDVRSVLDMDYGVSTGFGFRLRQCWALADSNANILQPCSAFQSRALLLVQASSPEASRWKEWIKQKQGTCIVSELPTVMEIAAVLKERDLDPSLTLPLVDKWGLSLPERATLGIAADPQSIYVLDGSNKTASSEASTVSALLLQYELHVLLSEFKLYIDREIVQGKHGKLIVKKRTGAADPKDNLAGIVSMFFDTRRFCDEPDVLIDQPLHSPPPLHASDSIPDLDYKYLLLHKLIGDVFWMAGGTDVFTLEDDEEHDESCAVLSEENIGWVFNRLDKFQFGEYCRAIDVEGSSPGVLDMDSRSVICI